MVRETSGRTSQRPTIETIPDNDERRESILFYNQETEEEDVFEYSGFMEACSERPQELFERIRGMTWQYRDDIAKKEAEAAKAELDALAAESRKNRTLQEMTGFRKEAERLKDVEQERDTYMRRIAQMSVQTVDTMRKKKFSKIPDPPTLTDGKGPRFDDWLFLINQKLQANHDHFDSPELRIAYIASRCEGKARRHITPRIRDETVNPYSDSKDMLDHLKTIYEDPNRITTAKIQFRGLFMKNSDKFHDFLSEFLYLAAEAGVTDDDLKEELYHKLTAKLQELTIQSVDSATSFYDFSRSCSQAASRLEVINHRTQRNKNFGEP